MPAQPQYNRVEFTADFGFGEVVAAFVGFIVGSIGGAIGGAIEKLIR